MSNDDQVKKAIDALYKQHGSRIQFIFSQLERLALTRQLCDVTLYEGGPELDVRIDPKFSYALMYGAGAEKLAELLSAIGLSNGRTVNIRNIWTLNPMPNSGFTEAELTAVDLAEGEENVGPNGETLRKMIADTYHCKDKDEEDKYLRRFIAS